MSYIPNYITYLKKPKIKELGKEYFNQHDRLVDKYPLMNIFHINQKNREDIIEIWRNKCELCDKVLELELLEFAHIIKGEYKDDPRFDEFVDHPVNVWILCPTCHRRVDKNLLKVEHIEKLKKQWKKHEMKFNEGCDELINLSKAFFKKIKS